MDGLEDRTSYNQVRMVFERYGKLGNVFVSKTRRIGRAYKFGFVRFCWKKEGLEAMKALDKKRLNRTFLSINPAKCPRVERNRRKHSWNVESLSKRSEDKLVWKRKYHHVQKEMLRKTNSLGKKEWRVKTIQSNQNPVPVKDEAHMARVGQNPIFPY